MDSKLLLGLSVAGGGAILAYDTGIIGGTNKEKQKDDPATIMSSPVAGGSPGLGAVDSGNSKKQESTDTAPSTKVTVEAPTIEAAPAVTTTSDPTTDSKKEDKSDDSSSDTDTSSSSSGSISDFEPSEDLKKSVENTPTADSDDPMSKKVEAPGVQSEEPDQVTRELNMEQGFTRTKTTAEMDNPPELDIGGGNTDTSSKKEEKSKDSGGGGLLDPVGDFFNDTIGWGDI